MLALVIRVLTIRQPWAWAIFYAGKDVENRDYRTSHRGRLYVQASKIYDAFGEQWLRDQDIDVPDGLPAGVILGHVDVVDCVDDSASVWARGGAYHWLLSMPTVLADPVPHRGLPGLHVRSHPL